MSIITTFLLLCCLGSSLHAENDKTVLLAILARNKEHVLPKFLSCIDALDYDKKLITVYINTNNNEDKTENMLKSWASKNGNSYREIVFESHTIKDLPDVRPHEWSAPRFKVLGNIRNTSMKKAKEKNCDFYFVVDCDNFITPCTLKELIAKDKPIIAPMLLSIPETSDAYSNYFCAVDDAGYYAEHGDYVKILSKEMKGTFKAPVVHCTYLIKTGCIDKLTYVDGSDDYEFVIFSKSARNNGIDQYICNEKDFGVLTHFHTDVSREEEGKRLSEYFASH